MTPEQQSEALIEAIIDGCQDELVERWMVEARADERRNTAEHIARAIETAADRHNRRIARIADVPYDPGRRDGMHASGIRLAARIARDEEGDEQ